MIKRYIWVLMTLLLGVSLHAQQNQLDKLSWLAGKWNRTDVKGDAQAFEEWRLSDQGLTGLGAMIDAKDTVFVERLSIQIKDKTLYYVAVVEHNTSPTYFEITSIGKASFECKNATHDFPKKISYTLNNDLLKVTISGNSRSMDFIFRKED